MPISPLGTEQLDAAQAALGTKFNDQTVLALALTHQSYVNEHPTMDKPGAGTGYGASSGASPLIGSGVGSNERLEFLGDSIIGMAVADRMFSEAPDLHEGDLTVRRSQVVRRETLAAVSRTIGLGQWLVMGKGEEAAGGAERTSNLADAFEAVVGAVFVDRGYRQTRAFVNRWLGVHIDEALDTETRKDPKSLLQEYLQANGDRPPRYRLVSESGPHGDIVFTMEVVIGSESTASGSGSRKIDAEREAARKALAQLKSAASTD
ncbi:MAG: ribonuclease III [Dehalococcoidia bacterium]|nr:ribonuclease III [Dehalococcoidia bacterium]